MTAARKTGSTKRVGIILVLVLLIVCSLVFAFFARGSFARTYAAYNAAELAYEETAYKPGADENPVRQGVNMLLAEVLQGTMTPSERIAKAQEGITLLNEVEEQIDDIKEKGDVVMPLLEKLEKQAHSPGNLTRKSDVTELVKLGRRQAEIIGDIRGLSYRADYYSTEIFERVIDDQGIVTDDHKRYLNDQIPQLETQFDNRTNLYKELQQNRERMNTIAKELGYMTE